MQEQEIKELDKREQKLCNKGDYLTQKEQALRLALGTPTDATADIDTAKSLIANLKAQINIAAKLTTIRVLRQALEEAMDREEASKPENQAEAVDDREAQAIEADSARDTK